MKKLALALTVAVLSTAVSGVLAGRTGDQLTQQEQQKKRVIAEKKKVAEMQAMMGECMTMMEK